MRGNNQPVPISDLIADHLSRQPKGGATRMAADVGVSKAAISRWAAGISIPEEWRADTIAEIIGSQPATVLAAIGRAKQLRHDVEMADPSAAERDADRISQLEERIDRLETMLTEALAELRRLGRGRPRGSR